MQRRYSGMVMAATAVIGGMLAVAAPASAATHTAAPATTQATAPAGNQGHNGHSYARGHGWSDDGWGWGRGLRRGHVGGYYRDYGGCQSAIGYSNGARWSRYSCDYTRRGYSGWNRFRFSGNDWRCNGVWVLRYEY